MESRKIKSYRIALVIIAVLLFGFSILDAIFFKLTSDSGLVSLVILVAVMGALNPTKSKKVKLNPKTEKILISASLILIVSGIITFFVVV
jgi:hypothetical protein